MSEDDHRPRPQHVTSSGHPWIPPAPGQAQQAAAPVREDRSLPPPRVVALLFALMAVVGLLRGGLGAGVGWALAERGEKPATLTAPPPKAPGRAARDFSAVAKAVLPSVVSIQVRGAQQQGTGSGFLIDPEGYVLTNNHVVGPATGGGNIQVRLNNDETAAAIVGRDPGLVRDLLADADTTTKAKALDAMRNALAPHHSEDGILIGAAAWLVTAQRP